MTLKLPELAFIVPGLSARRSPAADTSRRVNYPKRRQRPPFTPDAALTTAALAGILTVSACRQSRAPAVATGAQQLDSLPAPPPLPLSHFNVPLVYDYTPILTLVERVVPTTFGSIDSVHMVGDDPNRHYAYEAHRGPFTTFVRNNQVHLRATLSYAARGYFKPRIGPTIGAGCGGKTPADRPRVTVELVTPLKLTPDWHLSSHARLVSLQAASTADRDRCTVGIIHYDVTGRVVDAATSALTDQLPKIDKKIDAVDLTDHFKEWWDLLNRPIRLADNVWLLLGPERLRMGDVNGSGNNLIVDAGLDARPRVVAGSEPAVTAAPLPPLGRDTLANGFHIVLGSNIEYQTASKTISDALAGKAITEAGRTVTVRSARVSPLPHGQLGLAVTFTGDANGTLMFVGTPHYDLRANELSVPNLDYDLNTDSQLISAYAWLQSDALRSLFRDKARLPVKPLLDKGKSLLESGLNRKLGDAVTLSAEVDSVAVDGIYVTQPGLVVRAVATGHAGMQVKQNR
ncbi:MAG: DUF4403 family protein [Gemmatimonadota bacterium]|nr:DUF4403 family protein [Gemmatimonadota bacterium]